MLITLAIMLSNRFKWILALALPLVAVSAFIGWWFNRSRNPYSMDAVDLVREQRINSLIRHDEPKSHKIPDSTIKYLLDLESKCGDVHQEIHLVSDRLRKQNSFLNLTLKDVYAPFTSAESVYYKDLLATSPALFSQSIDEIEFPTGVGPEDQARIRKSLQNVIIGATTSERVDEADCEVINAAFKAGVNDPLLLAYVWYLRLVGPDEQDEFARRIYESRAGRELRPADCMMVQQALQAMLLQLDPEQALECIEESYRAIHQVANYIVAEKLDAGQQAFLFAQIYYLVNQMSFPARCELLDSLCDEKNRCKLEEVCQYVAYRINQTLAWSYRGGGYINSIAAEDLERFDRYSGRATVHALRAWTIAPHQFVLLPELMMLQRSSGTTGQPTWFWFRHCLAQVADYQYAYECMESSLMSRWGGTSQQRLWYIERCIDCDLAKSAVFFRHGATLHTYLQEEPVYPLPATWPRIVKAAESAIENLRTAHEAQPQQRVPKGSLSALARVLWRNGDFTNLHWLLDIHAECEPASHSRLERVTADDMRAFASFAAKSGGSSWKTIRTALFPAIPPTKKQSQKAVELTIKLRDESGDDASLKVFANSLVRRAQLLEQFTSGKEITFTSEDLQLWATLVPEQQSLMIVETPQMMVESKKGADGQADTVEISLDQENRCSGFEFTCKANQHGLIAMVPLYVSPPYRVEFDLVRADDVSTQQGDPYGLMLLCGARNVQDVDSNSHGPMFLLQPWMNSLHRDYLPEAAWDLEGTDFVGVSVKDLSKCRFGAEVFDNGFTSLVNGQIWESRLEPVTTLGWLQFGRYASRPYTGVSEQEVKYIVCNIKLKKLDTMNIENTEYYKEMQDALAERRRSNEAD